MRTSKDLTLKDNTYFTLLEYSVRRVTCDWQCNDLTCPGANIEFQEEYPPIIPNIGMGSLFINYYRKRDPEDTYIPSVGTAVLNRGIGSVH